MTRRRRAAACAAAIAVAAAALVAAPAAPPALARAGTGATVVSDGGATRVITLGAPPERGGVRPGSRGTGQESVSLPDGRRKVRAPSAYPNRAVGQLVFTQDSGPWTCTGWLVDADTILTSGHCVHEGGTDGVWSTAMTFHAGRQRSDGVVTDPYAPCGTTSMWAPQQWVTGAAEAHDWGLVHLDCDIGATTGWFGYFSVSGAHGLRGIPATVQGYPGDRAPGSYWKDQGRVVDSSVLMAFYDMDTFGGQSGSPVWRNRLGCQPCAMAVHSYGFPHGTGAHRQANHGPRITAARFDVITDLADDNG